MIGSVIGFLLAIAAIVVGYFIGKWRAGLRGVLLESEIRRLKNELRLRHLWAEQRRYELSRFVRLWVGTKSLTREHRSEQLQTELEKQAKLCGLTVHGMAAAGFPKPRELSTAEYLELAVLTGIGL